MTTKICANALCRAEFTPTPCRTPHRQRYCGACVLLSESVRRRTEPKPTRQCANPECGKVFTPRTNIRKQRYCCSNCRIRHDQLGRISNRGEMIMAKCPKCGGMHSVRMEWGGRGIPYIFCQSCNAYRCSETFCGTIVDHVAMGGFL
jgi:hypothetical protein